MSTEMPKRKFPGSAASALTGIATITESAREHQEALAEEDTSITSDYLDDLAARIAAADKKITGTDKRKGVRTASTTVKSSVKSAGQELGHLRDFIFRKYAGDKNDQRRGELLDSLGFSEHYSHAVGGHDQAALGSLLNRVDSGLSKDGLEKELTGNGLPEKRVTALRAYAASFKDQKLSVSSEAGKKHELTAEDTNLLNSLYVEVMGIARLGQRTFHDETAIRDRFIYEKAAPAGHHDDDAPADQEAPQA